MWYWISSLFITAFGQPAWIPGFGIIAAVFGYAVFWKGLQSISSPFSRFKLSVIWFAVVQGVQLSWIATPDYMGFLIIPLYLFLILCMGLQFGLISHFATQPLSYSKILAISGAWVVFEFSRLFFLCGFTWNPVGLALESSSYSLQFASIWGVFGLSYWVILVNLTLLKAWVEKSFQQGIFGVFLSVLPYLFGFLQQTFVEAFVPVSQTLKVALIQTDLAPEEKEYDPQKPKACIPPIDQWTAILKALEGEKQADLIIFPEAALPLGAHIPGYELDSVKKLFPEKAIPPLSFSYALFHRGSWLITNAFIAQALANQFQAHVIIGLDDRDFYGKYNAAFHFQPLNLIPNRYEKQILAPIAEYIPLGNWPRFVRFVKKKYGVHSSFDPGKEGKIFHAQVPIGVSICLEETFTHIMRQLRLKGAKLLVSVSNDAYFPGTKLGWQHFHHGRVRAVENGAPLLRSCNSGVTGGVDCFGRPLQILMTEKNPAALFFSFPIRSFKTLYTFWGDSAILAQSFLGIAAYLFLLRKKKLP